MNFKKILFAMLLFILFVFDVNALSVNVELRKGSFYETYDSLNNFNNKLISSSSYSGNSSVDVVISYVNDHLSISKNVSFSKSGYKLMGYAIYSGSRYHTIIDGNGELIDSKNNEIIELIKNNEGKTIYGYPVYKKNYYNLTTYSNYYCVFNKSDNVVYKKITISNSSKIKNEYFWDLSSYTIFSSSKLYDVLTSLPVPKAKNYTFLGWYTDKCGNGIKVTDDNGNIIGSNITYKGVETKSLKREVIASSNIPSKLYAAWSYNGNSKNENGVNGINNMNTSTYNQSYSACSNYVLRKGQKNDCVSLAQSILHSYSQTLDKDNVAYNLCNIKITGDNNGILDGSFGSRTKRCVMLFQKDMEIKVDGVIGPQTWGKLLSYVK